MLVRHIFQYGGGIMWCIDSGARIIDVLVPCGLCVCGAHP